MYADVRIAVGRWQSTWPGASLTYRATPGLLQITDERRLTPAGTYTFPDPVAAIYLACDDRPRSVSGVASALSIPAATVSRVFDELARRGLVFLDGDRALGLALPAVGGR
jgi:hypothetical protein